jgi:hypothetical protein
VLWRGQAPLIGDVNYQTEAVFAMDKWLRRVHDDTSNIPLSQKILADKPVDLSDRCTNGNGTDIPSEVCDETVSAYGTPRIGAGGPLADDTLNCQLQPLRKSEYPVTFNGAQWAALQKTFPDGVCNYNVPGQGVSKAIPWLTYQNSNGDVVYGGTPLGAPPTSTLLH